jgi:hypothetical protein
MSLVGASAADNQLEGTVGPGFTITLTRHGEPVTELTPGLYYLTVEDRAANHNFHVTGPGVDVEVTSVPFVGTVTVALKVKDGTFSYVCDPHRTTMHGTFVGLGEKDKVKPPKG